MKAKKISENIYEIDGERFVKEEKKGWLDVPELGKSFEIEVHDKNKSWDDLGLKDREAELPTMEDCKFLANNEKYAKILKMDGISSNDDFFIQQPFNLSRKNGRVAGFYVGSDYAGLGCVRYSDYSGSALGVRFARKISKKSK
jgi:hypothetical protein